MKYADKGIFIALFVLSLAAVMSIVDYIRTVNLLYQISVIQKEANRLPEDVKSETDSPSLQRVCGSPAADAYANVDPGCLVESPTTIAYLGFLHASKESGVPPDWKSVLMNRTDVDGIAVKWGIGNKKNSAQGCEQACINHIPREFGEVIGGTFIQLPCNAWVWCAEEVCWEPDAHIHTKGDCWLKFTEVPNIPEVNMRGSISWTVKSRHRNAPDFVPWVSGVLLLPGMHMTNGTWSPRVEW